MDVKPGDRFTRLLVVRRVDPSLIWKNTKVTRTMWECKCDCGNNVIVRQDKLVSGRNKSCGCLRQEVTGPEAIKGFDRDFLDWEKQKAEVSVLLREAKQVLTVAERLASKSIAARLKEESGIGFNKTESLPTEETRHFHREGTPLVIADAFQSWAEVMLIILKEGAGRHDLIGLDVNFYRKPNPSDDGPKENQ